MLIGSLFIQLFWHANILLFGNTAQLPGLPFSLDIILITSAYFICGTLLKDILIRFKPNVLLLILFIAMYLFISVFTNAHLDLNKRVNDEPFFTALGAFFGIYVILSISWYISKNRLLSYIPLRMGEASLYILIFHYYIQGKTYLFLSKGIDDDGVLIAMAIISLLLGVSIPLGIKWIVLRNDYLSLAFLPFKSNKLLKRTRFYHEKADPSN